jgi:hypothetical protein
MGSARAGPGSIFIFQQAGEIMAIRYMGEEEVLEVHDVKAPSGRVMRQSWLVHMPETHHYPAAISLRLGAENTPMVDTAHYLVREVPVHFKDCEERHSYGRGRRFEDVETARDAIRERVAEGEEFIAACEEMGDCLTI